VLPPDLDAWLPTPAVRIRHHARSAADPERTWSAARGLALRQTRLLGRLVRWRIPGVPADASFEELFRSHPFAVLEEGERRLVSGLVGRIWTLRRDYPRLTEPAEFREWDRSGTARVLFAHWVEPHPENGCLLRSEVRVQAFGAQGRIGLASVRPLIRGFQHLIATDALSAAVRAAEDRRQA
jgi:hypothetical protein